jgi:hypothetical protein
MVVRCSRTHISRPRAWGGAYFKGTAKRRALFELIVSLYKLHIEFYVILHVIWWIAGTLTIQQGGGLSRGGG